jgi:hypothetical protein
MRPPACSGHGGGNGDATEEQHQKTVTRPGARSQCPGGPAQVHEALPAVPTAMIRPRMRFSGRHHSQDREQILKTSMPGTAPLS